MTSTLLFRNFNKFEAGYILDQKKKKKSKKKEKKKFSKIKIKLTEEFSATKIEVSGQWKKIFKMNFQSKSLYLEKLFQECK